MLFCRKFQFSFNHLSLKRNTKVLSAFIILVSSINLPFLKKFFYVWSIYKFNHFPQIYGIVFVNGNPVFILNCFTRKTFLVYNFVSWWNNRLSFGGGDCRAHCFLILNNKTEQFGKRLGNRRGSQPPQHLKWSSLSH